MGGTKNCPETPRQKMIGMMYLVLTAMLALNVSNEVLNGFSMTEASLRSTISSANSRTESLYQDFESLNKQNPEKTGPWLEKALIVKQHADSLFNKLQIFKVEIIKIADGKKADPNAENIDDRENLDAAAEYAQLNSITNPKRRGKLLREQINQFRLMIDSINPSKSKAYNEIFNTGKIKSLHSGEIVDWETAMFEFMPAVAVTTLLTKYQSDVRAAESDVITYLKGQTDASDFRVNSIKAYALPVSSSYVIKGGKYTAQIVLSAVDSTLRPNYFVNGRQIGPDGIYEAIGSTIGENHVNGYIEMMRNGQPFRYDFKQSFTVGVPSATISNVDLNVVYRGIDNKFDISAPGVPSSAISVSVDGGSATKTGESRYNIRANRDGEITINVTASIEGKTTQMGSSVFRVKYLPNPKAFIKYTDAGGVIRQKSDAKLRKSEIRNNPSIIADYGEDELVKANFTILSFRMVTAFGSKQASGSSLTSAQLADIDKMEGGEIIAFRDIKAKGPDGTIRDLNSVVVEL
ncbi:MAG: gliding motility protein GldM [Paludibacter sp.]|nr:gliding motility protein GldM [Paludibacter sp.]